MKTALLRAGPPSAPLIERATLPMAQSAKPSGMETHARPPQETGDAPSRKHLQPRLRLFFRIGSFFFACVAVGSLWLLFSDFMSNKYMIPVAIGGGFFSGEFLIFAALSRR